MALQRRPAFDLLTDDPTLQTGLANDFQTAANEWMAGWDSIGSDIDAANAGMAESIPGSLAALDDLGNDLAAASDVFDSLDAGFGTLDPSDLLAAALAAEQQYSDGLDAADLLSGLPLLRQINLGSVPGLPPSSGSIPPISGTGSGGSGGSGGGSAPPPPPVVPPATNPCPSGFAQSGGAGNCVPTNAGGSGIPPILPPILTGPTTGETVGILVGGTLGTALAVAIPVVGAFLMFNWLFGSNWSAQEEKFLIYLTEWMQTDPIAVEIYSLTLTLQQQQAQLAGFPAGQAEREQLEAAIAHTQAALAADYATARATGFPP